MNSIAISPYDLLESGFKENPSLSSLKMDSMTSDDLIRVYVKPIKDIKTGRKMFDLCVEHRCSSKSWSDFHCFDFYVKSRNLRLSRRVSNNMNNKPLSDIVGYFVFEYFNTPNKSR